VIEEDAALQIHAETAATERFGPGRLEPLRQLAGGHSGITSLATFVSSADDARPIVIKSAPPGRAPVGRHDVLRQARVMRALSASGGVPVPEVYFESDGPPPFYGMEWVSGVSEEPVLEESSAETATQMADLWEQAVSLLVRLGEVELGALAMPDEPVHAPAAELERWCKTAAAAGPELEQAAAPLRDELCTSPPALERAALIHGDYRIGNTLRSNGMVCALIDWEIWSLGDPRADLGWLLLFTDPVTFPGLGHKVRGMPDRAAVLRHYEELVGARVADAPWFGALACFKLAAIQSHNLRRHREGRRRDAHLERFERPIGALLDLGRRLLA
jgi:aminoglycoside phosphotransferase (APT) family kinase protein